MLNVSSAFRKKLADGDGNFLKFADILLKDGTVLHLTNEHIWQGGFQYEDAVSSDSDFQVGAAIINKANLTINNIYNDFGSYDFDGAKVTTYIGYEIGNSVERHKKGTLTVDETSYNGSLIELECLDNMSKFDKAFSAQALTVPNTVHGLINACCLQCNVALATVTFPHYEFIINNLPDSETTTYREVIAWLAQLCGCFARCNPDGELEIKWYDQTGLTNALDVIDGGVFSPWTDGDSLDGGSYNPWTEGDSAGGMTFGAFGDVHFIYKTYNHSVSTDDVVITGVHITIKEDDQENGNVEKTYTAGTDAYVIDISGNPFITKTNVSTILQWLGTQLIGFTFRKANVSHTQNPTIEAGDIAILWDRHGNRYPIIVSRTSYTSGSPQTTISAAQTPARNSAQRFSADSKSFVELSKKLQQQKSAFEYAQEQLARALSVKAGLYSTIETTQSGNIYYLHDQPDLEDSNIVWKMTSEAFGVTTNYDGDSTVWNGGMTVNGDVIARILTAIGVNADWINSGAISISKTVSGQPVEVFYADVDTGTVRIKADSFSLSTGETLASTLTSAQNYANGVGTSTLASANSYADGVGSSTLSSAEAYTDTLDTSLNQAEVFKRLTNNRANQGIYIDNGNLYINASMIGAGTISADRIGANTIDVSKLNVSSLSAISADLGNITAGSINITGTGTGAGTITLSNGSLTATNVNLTGAITATSGSFTGSINATSGTFSGTISAGTYLGLPSTGMQVTSGGGLSGGGLSIGTTGISASTSGGASFNLTNGGAMTVTGGSYTGSVQNGSSIGALPVISTGLSYTSGGNTMSLTTSGLSMGSSVSIGVGGTGKISNIIVDTNAIYSTGHTAYDSATAGFYFGSDGSFGVGNSGSYMRFHNGSLDIRCATFSLAGQGIGDIASSYATAAENNSKSYADELLDAGESYTDTKMAAAVASANSYTDTQISQLPAPATLNQENVFNALTNNGRNQGIYLQSGELYINATYIASGTIAAGRIAASSIEASKLNITSLDHITNMMSGVHIESNKIYSGSHNTFNSSSAGFYLGSDGAFGVGNETNYVRFNTTSGQVDIKCSAFTLSGSSIQAIAQGEAYTAQLAAQSYADSQIADSADALQTYADNLALITADEVLDASESYADSILDSGKSYADSLFDDSKAYTDNQISITQQSIPELTQNSVFNALIGGNPANQGVYLTQDGKVYINAECIGAGTIGADRIGANSITAGKLSVTSLDAISANLGAITAGSITIGSGNYSFGLASNGKLTCSGADIRGHVGTGITLDGANSKITLSGYRGDSYIDGSTGQAAFGELKAYRNLTVGELLTSGTGNITAYGNITSYSTIYQGNTAVALAGHTHGFSDLTGVAASSHTHTEFNSAIDFKCNTTFFSGYTHAFHGTIKFHNLSSISSNSLMCFGNDGATVCYTSASSKRYKDVFREMTEEDIEKAFNIQPVIAKYKDGYLAKDDERNGVRYPMFIAEDVEKYIPEAADHRNGKTEDWNTRVMIPVMFQMIKSLKAEIAELKSMGR